MSKIKISPLQQALLESEEILKAVEKNAKDILFSQMRPDLQKVVRESIEADDVEDDAYDNSTDDSAKKPEDEFGDSPEASDDAPAFGGEPEISISPEGGDDDISVSDEPVPAGEDGDEMDLTGASDEDVISVFKKLGDDAEIEVVKDGNNININANGEEFIIKLNEEEKASKQNASIYKEPKTVKVPGSILEDEELSEEEKASKQNASIYKEPKTVKVPGSILENEPVEEDDKYSFMDEDEDKDENMYEIDLTSAPAEDEESIDEVARTHADGRKMERKPEGFFKYAASRVRPEQKDSVNESSVNDKVLLKEAEEKAAKLDNEIKTLNEDLAQHKNTLRQLREALETVAIFNTNLANVNRLFTSHATTLEEKHEIVKRFEGVETIKESKALYKTISAELKGKSPINETVESVINNKVSGSTGEQLLESSNVEANKHAAGLSRIQELIAYTNKK